MNFHQWAAEGPKNKIFSNFHKMKRHIEKVRNGNSVNSTVPTYNNIDQNDYGKTIEKSM